MENPPLQAGNKIYTLKPKFVTKIQDYFRKLKLGWYKRKKVKESKTPHHRLYHMKFKIRVDDELNPQVSDFIYEMVIPARAAFYSKILLENSVRKKVTIDVVEWDEMEEAEYEEFLVSKEDYITARHKERLTSEG
jgi:hypothetical protein